MRNKIPVLFLALSIVALVIPGFMINVQAIRGCRTQPGNTCNLEADSHVPASDGVVQVSISGGTYNGNCPLSCFNLNQTWALANATIYTIKVLNPFIIGSATGNRYTFQEWDYVSQYFDGSPSNPQMATPPMRGNYTTAQCHYDVSSGNWLDCPFTAVFAVAPPLGCKTNCNLDALTNVPSSDGTIKVSISGGTYNGVCPVSCFNLSHTWALTNGTTYTITVLNSTSFTGVSSGAKYVWKQWDCTGACPSVPGPTISLTLTTPPMYYNYTVSQSGAFTARYDKQYPLSLAFKDQSGNTLSPPTSLQLVSGSTAVSVTSFSGVYENALAWTIRNVVWEGINGTEVAGQIVDLTSGPRNATIILKAYQAAVKAVDNSNNPISGANVTIDFYNSTTRTFKTNSQGLAQLGDVPCRPVGNAFVCTYKATVSYNGQSSPPNCCIDASNSQNYPYVVQLNVGSAPVTTPLVSAAVLLAIFGVAAFLIILAVFVRKPTRAPQIDTSPP